jgi:hypothetical protein
MATTTPYGADPIPSSGDSDNVPSAFATYGASAETRSVRRFASAAARTTALTAASLGTGIRGMVTWLDSPGRYETHNGTGWVPLIASTLETDTFAVYGTNWDGVSPVRQIARRATVTTGSAGLVTVSLPTPFPNGLLNANMMMGDNTSGVLVVVPVLSIHRLNAIGGQALSASGVVVAAGVNIIINYTATGW